MITGWLTWLAWLALLAGILSVTINLIEGTIMLNDPNKSFEPWQSYLMMMAVLLLLYIINIYLFDTIPLIELLSGIFHIAMFFVYVGVLLGLTKQKHSANFVFMSRVDSSTKSGWHNDVISWHLGLLTPIWTFSGTLLLFALFTIFALPVTDSRPPQDLMLLSTLAKIRVSLNFQFREFFSGVSSATASSPSS